MDDAFGAKRTLETRVDACAHPLHHSHPSLQVAWRGPQMLNSSQAEHVPQRPFGKVLPSIQGDANKAPNAESLTFPENLLANVPGLETGGYDVLNLHLHGLEVWPHLFHPVGTSSSHADWISIEPTAEHKQQCYCYRFDISDSQNLGSYIYHTHRHGTSSVLTWGGMYGLVNVGDTNVSEAKYWNKKMIKHYQPGEDAKAASYYSPEWNDEAGHPFLYSKHKPNLKNDLAYIADMFGFHFEDEDVEVFVIGDLWLQYKPEVQAFTQSDFVTASRGNGMLFVTVNGEYEPTFTARTNALSLFRVICVSTANLCTFQIQNDETQEAVGFYQVASDGSTYNHPVWRSPKGSTDYPFSNARTLEAYLSQGGGQRDDVVVIFDKPGNYTIYSATASFDNNVHNPGYVTARVEVVESEDADETMSRRKGYRAELEKFGGLYLKSYKALSARKNPAEGFEGVQEFRAVSFLTAYNQEHYPFPFYGVSDFNKTGVPATVEDVEPYDFTNTAMQSTGGLCSVWTIRSPDIQTHPFHIHVNPLYVLEAGSSMAEIDSIMSFYPDYTAPWSTSEARGQVVEKVWRDTVMVPPFGFVRVQMCFDASPPARVMSPGETKLLRGHGEYKCPYTYTPASNVPSNDNEMSYSPECLDVKENTFQGKFVFHCHFLPHEDKGLMRNVYLVKGANRLYKKHAELLQSRNSYSMSQVRSQAVASLDAAGAPGVNGSAGVGWIIATSVLIGMVVVLAAAVVHLRRHKKSNKEPAGDGSIYYGTSTPAERTQLRDAR